MLDGKTVLITGAANGIGRAIAHAAAMAGARLILGDIAEDDLGKLADEISSRGASVIFRACDVCQTNQIQALVAAGAKEFAHPDIVYANAGIEGPLAVPWDYPEADFTHVIDVNVSGDSSNPVYLHR